MVALPWLRRARMRHEDPKHLGCIRVKHHVSTPARGNTSPPNTRHQPRRVRSSD